MLSVGPPFPLAQKSKKPYNIYILKNLRNLLCHIYTTLVLQILAVRHVRYKSVGLPASLGVIVLHQFVRSLSVHLSPLIS